MRYARVTHKQMDEARDMVLITLIKAGVTKNTFAWDDAFNVLMEAPNKAVLCKSFIKHSIYIYNNLSEI